MHNQKQTPVSSTRRDFLRASSAAAMGAAFTAYASHAARAAETGELKVGLIGCGGRGTGAAVQALRADPQAKLIALADTFPDYLDAAHAKLKDSPEGDRISVDEDHRFVGLDAYKGVIDSCDVVLLCATPAFRPKHIRAAVDAGKHVFAEKPIAVDGPGIRSVMDTCRMAREKKLNIVSGLCYRYQFAKRDVIQRVHDGAVGDIVALETKYNTGGLWHRGNSPDWSEMEYQIRNWIYFNWLSGDHINEQHIHSLDKIAWAMNEYPVKATASGGRIVRTDAKYGNVYDHFNTTYEWANGVRGFSSCRQWEGADTDVSDHVYGTQGVAHIQTHEIQPRKGSAWKHQPEGPDDMYQNEHDALFRAIRNGDTIVDEYMCDSTLMALMGRESAYTGRTVTRDEILHSDVRLGPENPAWGPSPVPPVPSPGVHES